MKKQQSGFTLIELVIVIIVLGILSATAVPKFINLRDDAEISRVKALGAAYQQAVSFINIRWNMLGVKGGYVNMPGFGDGTVDVSDTGYPIGTNKGNSSGFMSQPRNIGKGNQACVNLWDSLLETPPSVSLTDDGSDFQAYRRGSNGSNLSECHYIFRVLGDTATTIENAKVSIKYDSITGKVTTTIQ